MPAEGRFEIVEGAQKVRNGMLVKPETAAPAAEKTGN